MNFFRTCANVFAKGSKGYVNATITSSLLKMGNLFIDSLPIRNGTTLERIHKYGFYRCDQSRKNPLGPGRPFAKGVVLKTLIKKPKKPNSANRKCVLVRLSTGKDMIAHIPGEGHNLQEHSVVLVRPGRTKDVPGLKLKCIRGKYDLGHVIKPSA